jgi:hypothetical protein
MMNMNHQYIRTVDGKTDFMIEIKPGEAINTVSAVKLGLIRKETLDAPAIKKAA